MRTSRARRLNVVEPSLKRQGTEPQEPPAGVSEVPQPDSADAADMDARLAGMSMLLRTALRLMKSYEISGRRRTG
jgi:hypothetical protein